MVWISGFRHGDGHDGYWVVLELAGHKNGAIVLDRVHTSHSSCDAYSRSIPGLLSSCDRAGSYVCSDLHVSCRSTAERDTLQPGRCSPTRTFVGVDVCRGSSQSYRCKQLTRFVSFSGNHLWRWKCRTCILYL